MMQRPLISIFHRQLIDIYNLYAVLGGNDTCLGACVQDWQLFARQWLQIGILADLLFLLRFAWICYSGPNLLFPATRVKWSNTKVGGLWIKGRIISKYFWKLKTSLACDLRIPVFEFQTASNRSVDLDWCWWNWLMLMVWSLLRMAAPVLWCWWWHQCFGVTLVSDKRGAVSPPDVGHQGHLGGIVTTWKIINKK